MKTAYAIAVLGSAALVGGCGGRATSSGPQKTFKPPSEFTSIDGKSLLPLQTGNSWTYQMTNELAAGAQQGTQKVDVTFEVKDVSQTADGTKATMDVTINGKPADQIVWLVNDQGIYQLSLRLKPVMFVPKQPAVMFPVKPGGTFTWKGSGAMPTGGNGTGQFENKVDEPELIDTQDGRKWALPIETSGNVQVMLSPKKGAPLTPHPGQALTIQYWIPNVGIGKVVTKATIAGVVQTTQTLSLKKFVPKPK